MKRTVIVLLSVLALTTVFISCGAPKELHYTSYVYDVSTNTAIGIEMNFSIASYENKDVPRKRNVLYEGEYYKLNYMITRRRNISPFAINVYETQDHQYKFSFRCDNDQLTEYIFDGWESDAESTIPLSEARKIADTYAGKYISIDEYTVEEKLVSYEWSTFIKYSFSYIRYVNGMPTWDRVNLELGNDGTLIWINWVNAGLFSKDTDLEIDLASVDKSVTEKTEKVLREKYIDFTLQDVSRKLVYTPEGELGVMTDQMFQATAIGSDRSEVIVVDILTVISSD